MATLSPAQIAGMYNAMNADERKAFRKEAKLVTVRKSKPSLKATAQQSAPAAKKARGQARAKSHKAAGKAKINAKTKKA